MTPFRFIPIYQNYIWGGRTLEKVFGRKLPEGVIAESWELVDRPDAQSIVADGEFKGLTLRQLIEKHGREILSENYDVKKLFPLLIKWLDAKERLSLQVHPPANKAQQLNGEPKTECWYIKEASESAGVYAGLKNGVRWENFDKAFLQNGVTPESKRKFENLIHRLPTKPGDFIFIPSGRLHAIDAGNLILEIQQNSNTTYRVYDWGRPRELHIDKSLASIDFNDFEPNLIHSSDQKEEVFIKHPIFSVKKLKLDKNEVFEWENAETASICTISEGKIKINLEIEYAAGDTVLIPRASSFKIQAVQPSTLIITTDFL